MDDRGHKRKGKRILDDDDEEDNNRRLVSTEEETPSFVSVLLEAMMMNGVRYVCPYLTLTQRTITREELHPGNWELLLCKIFDGELLRTLGCSNHCTLAGESLVVHPSLSRPPTLPGSGGQKLQLCVKTKMPNYLFAGDNIKGEGGSEIHVCLVDLNNGSVVRTGSASAAEVTVVVLEGGLNEEIKYGREHEFFKSHQVKERVGKPPLLVGTIKVTLKDGMGVLGSLSCTDNSSFTRSKKFRLGFELDTGCFDGIRVMEAKTNAFQVKDQRGKNYKKHSTPALLDDVWRLTNIAKDGPRHKRLDKAKIKTVEDLVRLHVKDPQRLRTIVDMKADTEWETTIKNAMNFRPLGEKFYVYYTDGTKNFGIIFNHIYEPWGLISDRQVAPLESIHETQKKLLVKKAYENWNQVVECDEQLFSSIISKEMQHGPTEDAFISPTQTGHIFHSDPQIQPNYAPAPQQSLKPSIFCSDQEKWSPQNVQTGFEDLFVGSCDDEFLWNDALNIRSEMGHDTFSYSSDVYNDLPLRTVKAVVGWLKIKAVLKWGIMVRNSAAKKRAKLTELE